ncbi:MAG TPA: hypothetical protein ENH78_13185 [Phycisphaerae bacterium]|nr:hypothetical protein [Phycisphaerae bacterium]
MSWTVTMWPDATSVDTLLLRGMLLRMSSQKALLDLYPERAPIRIVLTRADTGAAVEHELVWYRDCHLFRWARGTGRVDIEIDLKELFGKLQPGRYTVQVVLPAGGYAITGLPESSQADISSSEFAFEIVDPDETVILDARARLLEARSRELPLGSCLTRGDNGTALLTNGLPFTVLVPFKHKNANADETADEVVVVPYGHVLAWRATGDWATTHLMGGGMPMDVALSARLLQDDGWSMRSLAPSESMTIDLPDRTLQDGIYCYDVLVFQEREGMSDRSHRLTGMPFVVEGGRIAALRGADEHEPGD